MDVLSDVIAVMRTGEPRSACVERHAPWEQRYCAVSGAGFHVVLQGSCWLIPEACEPIELGVGDVVFLPRGGAHSLADSPAALPRGPAQAPRHRAPSITVTLCGAYQLDPSLAHPMLTSLPEIVCLPARLGHRPELRAAVDLLGSELNQRRPGSDAAVPALLDTLLLYILRSWLEEQHAQGAATGWATALRDPGIAAALDSIHRDPSVPWTVEQLGMQAGLSRAAFARRFAALTGQPPLSYLTWWRMTIAARMLRATQAPLSAVAKQVGYGSEFAFAAAFKRQYGTAPGKYRRSSIGC